ncbi:MAG: methyltransferase, TIGR04325 family, partial [Verrucomicrobiota bacterium]|nr:methyltransferase, TIGR04325 family [Verrucomicrobiota bacterium]
IGQFIRRITPPILLDIFRRSHQEPQPDNLWDGIYPNHREVPSSGRQFDGDTWIRKTREYTEGILAAAREQGTIPTQVTGEHMLLPLLASLVCEGSNREISILDFGGGMGIAYVQLVSSLINCRSITYHVVEREGVCEAGGRLFEKDKNIHFSAEIPAHLANLSIVYISSALQYVEDYQGLLKKLTNLGARYFLFVKLSAGDLPTYATAQKNVPGTTLPYWFINAGEVIEIMAACGYSLIYKSALEQEYEQNNFPAEYRLGRACNLLFSRN